MEGFFFSSEETQVKKPMLKMSGCGACKLHRGCNTPRMEAAGKGEKKILIIAEAPGASEDRRGIPMVGEAGQVRKGYYTMVHSSLIKHDYYDYFLNLPTTEEYYINYTKMGVSISDIGKFGIYAL